MILLRAKVRHTTVIVLPAGETILDFVVGDAEYWHLAGSANVAFLKPLAADAATNVALICESGRIYSFLATEQGDGPPHLVVRLASGAEVAGLSGSGRGEPAFVARREVAVYRQMAAEASDAARQARGEAEARAASEIEAFRSGYPGRLAFAYRFGDDAADRPFLVEAMWHDGEFTYSPLARAGVAGALRAPGRRARPGRLRPNRGRAVHRPPRAGRRMAPDR